MAVGADEPPIGAASAIYTTLQEKTLATKRWHVLDATIAVFAQKGFRGATIRDAAKVAGVADGTIYNLFANKAALLVAILEGHLSEPKPPEATGGQLPISLHMLLRARWAALDDDSFDMLRVVLAEALVDEEFRDLYRGTILTPAIAQLEAPLATLANKNSALLETRLVTAMFLGLVMLRLRGDDVVRDRADDLPDLVADFLVRGLGVTGKQGSER